MPKFLVEYSIQENDTLVVAAVDEDDARSLVSDEILDGYRPWTIEVTLLPDDDPREPDLGDV